MRPPSDPPSPPRVGPDLGELLLAVAVVGFGALVLWQTTQIRVTPAYSKVGPRVIPYIIGTGLVLVGLWLAAEAASGRGAASAAPVRCDWRCIAGLATALVVYAVAIEPAGFVVASVLLFVGAALAMGSRRVGRDAAVAVVIAVVLFEGFTRGLGLDLPAGVLGAVL